MVAGEPGFRVDRPRNQDEEGLKDIAFYYDEIHPDGRTGARCVA